MKHPDEVKANLEERRKRSKLIGWVCAIVVVLSVALGVIANVFGVFDHFKKEPATEPVTQAPAIVQYGDGVVIGGDVGGDVHVGDNIYNQSIDLSGKTTPEKLAYAYALCKAEQYEDALKVYLALPDSVTAQCNLGYLYTHGLGTGTDIMTASEYYDKARELGSTQALQNQLAMHLQYSDATTYGQLFEPIHELMREGQKTRNSAIISFINANQLANFVNTDLDFGEDVYELCYVEGASGDVYALVVGEPMGVSIYESLYECKEDPVFVLFDDAHVAQSNLLCQYRYMSSYHDSEGRYSNPPSWYQRIYAVCNNLDLLDEKLLEK